MSNPARKEHPDTTLEQAKWLHNAGLLSEAKTLYEKALKKQPKSFNLYYILGELSQQEGKPDEALTYWKKAAALAPQNADIHSNVSALLLNSARYKECEEYATRALAIQPGHKQALYNLGASLSGQKRHKDAYPVLMEALQINPDHPEYLVGAGNAEIKAGNFEQGLVHLRRALSLAPDHGDALYSTIIAQIVALPMEKRGELCLTYLKHPHQKPALRADILLRLAIHFWVSREYAYVAKCIGMFAADAPSFDPRFERNYKIIKSFFIYLAKLMETSPTQKAATADGKKIFMIGDSHILSYTGQVIPVDGEDHHVVPFFTDGGKAWHLGDGQSPEYGYIFRAALSHRPEGARCWLSFGEIDCRIDEGIQMVKKGGKSLEAIARHTAKSYVERTSALLREHGVTPAYLNVPAPHVATLREAHTDLTDERVQNHIKTIEWFNDALQIAAHAQNCPVIDLYGLTKGPDGTADGKWHIDGHHLVPEALGAAERGS